MPILSGKKLITVLCFRRCVVDVTTTEIGETRCSQKETHRLFPTVAVKSHTVNVERILM